jgi:hypothetical protein
MMNKRKLFGIALIFTAVLLLAATGAVAAKSLLHGRGPISGEEEENYEDEYFWGPMHGYGMSGDLESGFGLMVEALADVSELTLEEIEARINNGEHLFTIAADAGLSQEDFYQMMFDVRRSYSEGVVEQGQLSDDDQWMFDHMDEFQGQPFYVGCHGFYPSEFESNYQRDGRDD